MASRTPDPWPGEMDDAATASENAGIADESAAYEKAIGKGDGAADHGTPTEESSAHPS